MRSPDLLGDERAGEDTPGILHEDLEERVFSAREVNGLAVDLDRMTEQVEADSAMLQDHLFHGGLAAHQRAHARQQLLEAEGLRKVVVRANVQTLDAILD